MMTSIKTDMLEVATTASKGKASSSPSKEEFVTVVVGKIVVVVGLLLQSDVSFGTSEHEEESHLHRQIMVYDFVKIIPLILTLADKVDTSIHF